MASVRMRRANAKHRLSKLEFQADEDWDAYPRSNYTCPRCQKTISFNLKDLDHHSFSSFTNLSSLDQTKVESIVGDNKGDANSFLDFYCPGCKSPVRIYFQSWAGGRYTHGHIIKFIIEENSGG